MDTNTTRDTEQQPAATPTDKMLELIDAELKKEAHR